MPATALKEVLTVTANEGGNKHQPVLLANVIQLLQLGTLIIGLILVAANMGAKGERLDTHTSDIKELKSIASDLVKAQVAITKGAEYQGQKIKDLEDRLKALEGRNNAR